MGFALENVGFAFKDREVLSALSLAFSPGRFHGIVGPNGSGKTTLLDLLMGHRRPGSGTIRYHGKPLSAYSRRSLSREMALVPQNFYIDFPFTAWDIVLMGRYPHLSRFAPPGPEDLDRVSAVMERTGTLAFKDRLITGLSGGERQRVVFARALAQDTPVLLLDEATSNLDIHHALELLTLTAQGVREGKTVVAVFQDINLAAAFCDELVFVKNGGIAAQGPVAEVLTSAILREVFAVEADVRYEPRIGAPQVVFRRCAESC